MRDHGNERAVTLRTAGRLRRTLDLVFRAYDDGVAFRYVIPKQPNMADFAITSEETRFRFAGDHTVFWSPADYDSYEHLYRTTPLSEMRGANTPVTMRTAEGLHLCLHEASLVDYADMTPSPPRASRSP